MVLLSWEISQSRTYLNPVNRVDDVTVLMTTMLIIMASRAQQHAEKRCRARLTAWHLKMMDAAIVIGEDH